MLTMCRGLTSTKETPTGLYEALVVGEEDNKPTATIHGISDGEDPSGE